jgi:hypothetical protein
MTYIPGGKKRKTSRFGPLLGFFILVGLGAFSFFTAPYVIRFLTTTQIQGAFGPILPIPMPSQWSFLTTRLVIAGFMFMVQFIIFMIVIFAIRPTARGEMDIDMADMRKEFEAKKKMQKKRGR